MHPVRSDKSGSVVIAYLSCGCAVFTTVVCVAALGVVFHQSLCATDRLELDLRVRYLETENAELGVAVVRMQKRLEELEKRVTSQLEMSSVTIDSASEPSQHKDLDRYQGRASSMDVDSGSTKGDDGILDEEEVKLNMLDDIPGRGIRSSRRHARQNSPCGNCKGEKGQKGDFGRTQFGGQKGDQGETGPQGPKGYCEQHQTPSTPTSEGTTQASDQWSPLQPTTTTLLAAHFEGSRRATVNIGETGWVTHWRYAHWMDDLARSRFILHHQGNVTVTEGGIYYVYSQMLYYDPNVFMGHSIYIGNQKKFSCTECTVDQDRKFNTCYIGGVIEIRSGDKIGIKVTYANRVINLHPDSTHFGLIRLSP